MPLRPIHPNVLSNHKYRFKSENGHDCSLSDNDIIRIIQDNELTKPSTQEEDDEIQRDMLVAERQQMIG